MEHQFVLEQLLIISMSYDISDVLCRNTLKQTVATILQNCDIREKAITVAVQIIEHCVPNVEQRCHCISEIIAEIMCPSDNRDLNSVREELTIIKEEYQMATLSKIRCVNEEDYLQAAEHQKRLDELEGAIKSKEAELNAETETSKTSDPDSIKKYLDIAAALLCSPQITALSPTLVSLKQDVIQECLMHPNESIQTKALKCYVLCCLVDKASAKIGIHICSVPVSFYSLRSQLR